MKVYDAIMARRTIRKFTTEAVSATVLEKLIDCARVAAYGANMQPLKFKIAAEKSLTNKMFACIKWAGYLSDGAPKDGERPPAYIAILGDTTLKPNKMFETEAGAAATTMMLAAVEEGLGTCWLGAIDRERLHKLLELPTHLQVVYLLAVGYPAQESHITDMQGGDVKYYLDEQGVLHVPKRSLDEILIK